MESGIWKRKRKWIRNRNWNQNFILFVYCSYFYCRKQSSSMKKSSMSNVEMARVDKIMRKILQLKCLKINSEFGSSGFRSCSGSKSFSGSGFHVFHTPLTHCFVRDCGWQFDCTIDFRCRLICKWPWPLKEKSWQASCVMASNYSDTV